MDMDTDTKKEQTQIKVEKPKSLAELRALCEERIPVRVPIGRRIVELEVRLLRPEETDQLELILAEAHPPTRTDETGKVLFDRSDPEYLKKLARVTKEARALALAWCCPLVAEAIPPGTVDRAKIFEAVQKQLTDVAQEMLYAVARSEQMAFEERLGF